MRIITDDSYNVNEITYFRPCPYVLCHAGVKKARGRGAARRDGALRSDFHGGHVGRVFDGVRREEGLHLRRAAAGERRGVEPCAKLIP